MSIVYIWLNTVLRLFLIHFYFASLLSTFSFLTLIIYYISVHPIDSPKLSHHRYSSWNYTSNFLPIIFKETILLSNTFSFKKIEILREL